MLPTNQRHSPALQPHGPPLLEHREPGAALFIALGVLFLILGGVIFSRLPPGNPSRIGDAVWFVVGSVVFGLGCAGFGLYSASRKATTYVCHGGIVEVSRNEVSRVYPWETVTELAHLTVHRAGVDTFYLRVLVGKEELRLALPEGSDARALVEQAAGFWRKGKPEAS
jgi:hypothetical protein